jgi:segregation and condensation protein B
MRDEEAQTMTNVADMHVIIDAAERAHQVARGDSETDETRFADARADSEIDGVQIDDARAESGMNGVHVEDARIVSAIDDMRIEVACTEPEAEEARIDEVRAEPEPDQARIEDDRAEPEHGMPRIGELRAEPQADEVHFEDARIEGERMDPRADELRILEAMLFAAEEPLDEKTLGARLPDGIDVHALLERLQAEYSVRGVNLVRVGGKWSFRTAGDLAWLLTRETVVTKKLSRAAIETLAIVAYHQPVTRAEIEEIRGVSTSKGTLDVLLETGWIRLRGRRKAPGRPVTYGTSEAFMSHFGLDALSDLPGLDELKGAGLVDPAMPSGFTVPVPNDDPALREDEDPLEPGDLDLGLAPPPERTEQ